MKQLSFGTERTKHHNVLHNPFLKLGAALLASLSLACPQQDAPKTVAAKPAQVSQGIAGKYTCNCTKNPYFSGAAGARMNFSIYQTRMSWYMADNASSDLGLGAQLITKDENGFHFVLNTPSGTTSGTGRFLADGSLRYVYSVPSSGNPVTFEYTCRKQGTRTKEQIKNMKAVFTRPGLNSSFSPKLYASYIPATTLVGGGSLKSVATDLLNSGVTDIFIGFKTDFAWYANGHVGDLLFDSKQGGYGDSISLASRKNGFDPIAAFMNACRNAYRAAGKKVYFHAWFPVFADEYAAKKFGGEKGHLNTGLVGAVSGFLNGNHPNCVSDTFAEPSNPEVVAYELAVLRDLVNDYPWLSGINLDYVRYSDLGTACRCGNKTGTALYWDVNAAAVTDFVKKVKAKFPNLVLSADIRPDLGPEVGQDGILQYLDFAMPMEYTKMPGIPTGVIGQTIGAIQFKAIGAIQFLYPNLPIVPDLRGFLVSGEAGAGLLSDLGVDIKATKAAKSNGYAIFTYEYLLNNSASPTLASIKDKIGY